MARFMSGEENTKYDKVTDPEMIERMNRFEDNVGNVIKTNVEDISNEINALRTDIYERYDYIKVTYDMNRNRITVGMMVYLPLLVRILVSAPFRFLNCIFHWYLLDIVDDNAFDEKYQCNPYWVITLYNTAIFGSEMWDYYNSKECWDQYREKYKIHRAQLKKRGLKLKDVKIKW